NYVPSTHDILIDHLAIIGGGLHLDTTGRITLIEKLSPVAELKGRIASLSARDLLRYWPLGAADGARTWISGNIFNGSVGPIEFETHFPAGMIDQDMLPDGALLMTFPIANAEANYLTGLTHLTAVQGNARLTGNSFTVDVKSARVGPLVVTRGHALIPDLVAADTPGTFTAHIDGTMSDILKLTELPPLHYPTRFGIDPNQTKGSANVDLDFRLPLRKNLSIDAVAISVKAAVSGFGIGLSKDLSLSDGTVNFDIDNNRLHASGTACVATSRLTLDWIEN